MPRRRRPKPPTRAAISDTIDFFVLVAASGLALVLGGASRGAFVAHGILEITFASLLIWTILARRDRQFTNQAWTLAAIGGVFLFATAISIVPLPGAIWTALPGRGPIAEGFAMLGAPPPPLPISLAPEATLATLPGFLPPFAAFCFAAGVLTQRAGRTIAWTLPVLACISLAFGIAQVFDGETSRLYVYEFQNRGSATGFFSNVNHQSTLGLMALPFLGALAGHARFRAVVNQPEHGKVLLIVGMTLLAMTLVVFSGSLAGLLMLGPTLAVSYLIAFGLGKLASLRTLVAAFVVVLVGFIGFAVGTDPIVQGFLGLGQDGPGSRLSAVEGGTQAAITYFPFGSGLGSFMAVFPAFEPAAPTSTTFMAHAHNEYIELAIELGAIGLFVLAAALFWWASQGISIWRSKPSLEGRYKQAAWTALAVVAVHSLVDFPLRTPGLAVAAALCAGLLASPTAFRRTSSEPEANGTPAPKHVDL